MMKSALIKLSIFALPLLIIIAIYGCSNDNITAPSNNFENEKYRGFVCPAAVGDSVQFAARVMTTEQSMMMLTFHGCSDTVIAAHNCAIVRLKNDTEAPIPFVDIVPGDSANMYGVRMQNGYVNAYKIQICCDSNCIYDLAFRDTITAIDYGAGTFSVAQHTETIHADSNTYIWVNNPYRYNNLNQEGNESSSGGGTAKISPEGDHHGGATVLTFADLQVGDVVEVKANIIDPTALLALKIKVANCPDPDVNYVDFEANLASVDTESNTVTWVGFPWLGLVCKGTSLIGADGESLTLDDFTPGENVYVKGHPLEADSLKVCEMRKL